MRRLLTRFMTTVVVAMGFVSDARSNGVSNGVSRASCHSGSRLLPTSTVAAGKTPDRSAFSRTRRAGFRTLPQKVVLNAALPSWVR
jgi:hypothetical protein